MSNPVFTYVGEKVALGPVTREALPRIGRWQNDPSITLPLSNSVTPQTEQDIEAWYEQYGVKGDGSTVHFLVYLLTEEPPLPIGMVNLFAINLRNQTAWAASYIGERDLWGQGYGTEARKLLLKHAFGALGLNNVTVAIFADNVGSLSAAVKTGYRLIGRQRQGVRRGKSYEDVVFMDILASDFYKESPRDGQR